MSNRPLEATKYKFIVFDEGTHEPVDVAKTRKDAQGRVNIFKNAGREGYYKIVTYKKMAQVLNRMQDPDGMLKRIEALIEAKMAQ